MMFLDKALISACLKSDKFPRFRETRLQKDLPAVLMLFRITTAGPGWFSTSRTSPATLGVRLDFKSFGMLTRRPEVFTTSQRSASIFLQGMDRISTSPMSRDYRGPRSIHTVIT